ncbi:hypothetical protein AB4120_14850 [Cupriavidus sp. 2KB_3]|uniref:hypothetical protein n=1 Tax=Cupriavidus sp. 2KB_3 TaxID=3232980 RepID=UPI003F932054
MTIEWKPLVSAATLTTTPVSLYTVGGTKQASIQAASAYNNTAGSLEVYVYLVPPGGAVADDTTTVFRDSVPANKTLSLAGLVNHKMAAGAQIYAKNSANGLFLNISGAEHS